MSLMCQGEVFFGRAVGGRSTIDQSRDAKKGRANCFFACARVCRGCGRVFEGERPGRLWSTTQTMSLLRNDRFSASRLFSYGAFFFSS